MTSFPSSGSINLHALHVTREMLIEAIREKQAPHYSSRFATHRDAAEGQLYPVRFNKKVQRFELGGPLTCGIRNQKPTRDLRTSPGLTSIRVSCPALGLIS